jgi:hypothetical protein
MQKPIAIIIILAAVALAPGAATVAAAMVAGGQDILIDRFTDDDMQPANGHVLAIASDGTCFDVFDVVLADGAEVIRVYRSDNGGSTWSVWGEITDPDPVVDFRYLQAAVAPGTPERLLIAYNRWDETSGLEKGTVKVTSARVSAASPNWISAVVDGPSSSNFLDLSLDAMAVAGGDARVHLAYLRSGASGWERTFARSLDGGATWSTPASLGPIASLAYFEQDIAADDAGVVHWLWIDGVSGGTKTLRLQTATNDGTLAADWGAAADVDSSTYSAYKVGAAAEPGGDGLIVVVSEFVPPGLSYARLRVSTDAGATWPHPEQALEFAQSVHPAWGGDGPAVAAKFNQLMGLAANSGFGLYRPDGDPTGAWSFAPLIEIDEGIGGETAVAADPSRGGRFAVAGKAHPVAGGDDTLWFDAEWRSDPGYGVPETRLPAPLSQSSDFSSPVAGDLDGDGDLEVVYTTPFPESAIWRFDLETGAATLLADLSTSPAPVEPMLLDIDGDGACEVFYSTGAAVHGIRGDSARVDGFPVAVTTGSLSLALSGGQVTGFTHGEIAVVHDDGLWLLGPGGLMRTGFPVVEPVAGPYFAGDPAIGDVDGDGAVEIVLPTTGGLAVIGPGGQHEALLTAGGTLPGDPSLADLDGDGDLEIAFDRADGTVHVIHHDGSSFGPGWPYSLGSLARTSSIALADLAGDGRRDLVFSTPDSTVHVVDTDGGAVAQFAVPMKFGWRQSPVVADLGPAGPAVARGGGDGLMHVFRSQQEQDGWPRDFGAPIYAAALATDLDGDGAVEMVVEADDGLWVLDMGVAPGPVAMGWRMHGARPDRSNCADCPGYSASSVEEAQLPTAPRLLHQNAPNPFNPSTTIRFANPARGAVRLRVFDVSGRLVRTLVDEVREAGLHEATWDGRDQGGRAAASGVYLYRLDAGPISQMRSMVLMK